jgi:hypothetical protein
MSGLGGTLSGATVTIGTSAALIKGSTSGRESIVIQNVHASNDLYVGPSGVTTSSGVKVPAGQSITFDDYIGPVYGIASAASTDVRYLEVS